MDLAWLPQYVYPTGKEIIDSRKGESNKTITEYNEINRKQEEKRTWLLLPIPLCPGRILLLILLTWKTDRDQSGAGPRCYCVSPYPLTDARVVLVRLPSHLAHTHQSDKL